MRTYTVILLYPLTSDVETYTAFVEADSRTAAMEKAISYACIDNDHLIPPDEFRVLFVIDGRATFLSID